MKKFEYRTSNAKATKTIQAFKKLLLVTTLGCLFLSKGTPLLLAQADLYIKDTPADVGNEPNIFQNMWSSQDIWVLTSPDPNYSPVPFPTSSPPWTPPAHQNSEYRDPTAFPVPNWIYVRITNRGDQPSAGATDRLKVYWAKGHTALNWPTNFNDHFNTPSGCTDELFLGEEITKTRKDAASVSTAERTLLKDAILELDDRFYLDFVSWWDKQDEIHDFTHNHCGPSFLPWHRELINRFELLLRGVKQGIDKSSRFQTLKLYYWDWTTDPRTGNSVNLFTNDFMGNAIGGVTVPFPANFSTEGQIFRSLPFIVPAPPPIDPDASIVSFTTYAAFRNDDLNSGGLENNHNSAHGYIGGTISDPHTSFQDPFVYILHANVDRILAMWQRNTSFLNRLIPYDNLGGFDVYGNERNTTKITTGGNPCTGTCLGTNPIAGIQTGMEPWNGLGCQSGVQTPLFPWTSGGGEILTKTATDPSVVSPPFYDDVPLTIPVLQPGESVIMQIPWYPPDPDDYLCFGAGHEGHLCIVARIETSPTSPFGMTVLETTQLGPNNINNNNIAVKNIEIIDDEKGPGKHGVLVGNANNFPVKVKLAFKVPTDEFNKPFLKDGAVKINLGPDVYDKWVKGGKKGTGFEEGKFSHMSKTGRLHHHSLNHFPNAPEARTLRITANEAVIENLDFDPLEYNAIEISFDYNAQPQGETKKIFNYDIEQFTTINGIEDLAGGFRYNIHRPDCQLPDAGSNVTIPNKASTSLSATPIIQGATYIWRDDKNGNIVGTGSTLVVSPDATTTYELELSNPNGCIDFDVVTVTVDKKLHERLVFTPNPTKDNVMCKYDVENAQNARLEIRNVNTGQIEKQFQLDITKDELQIWVGNLKLGAHSCFFFTDNVLIATKQLIIMP